MQENIAMGLTGLRVLCRGFRPGIARAAAMPLLFLLLAGCEAEDCTQYVHRDSNGDIYYTYKGEDCGQVVYPPDRASRVIQFDQSFWANIGTSQEK